MITNGYMKRLQILIVLLLTTNTIVFGQIDADTLDNRMKNSIEWASINEETYEINVPANWEVDQSGQMGTSFILFSPVVDEKDIFRENVNLLIQDLTGYDLNLDQFVELSEGQIKTLMTEGNMILSERKKQEEGEYHQFIYTAKQGIFDLKFEQYFWVIENQAFVLTLTCEEEEFKQYQETGEKILDSFVLK